MFDISDDNLWLTGWPVFHLLKIKTKSSNDTPKTFDLKSEQPVLVEDTLVLVVELAVGSSNLLEKTSDSSELNCQSVDLSSVLLSVSGWSSSELDNHLFEVINLNNKFFVDLAVLRSLFPQFVEEIFKLSDVISELLILFLELTISNSSLGFELFDERSDVLGLDLTPGGDLFDPLETSDPTVDSKFGTSLPMNSAELSVFGSVDLAVLQDVNTEDFVLGALAYDRCPVIEVFVNLGT